MLNHILIFLDLDVLNSIALLQQQRRRHHHHQQQQQHYHHLICSRNFESAKLKQYRNTAGPRLEQDKHSTAL